MEELEIYHYKGNNYQIIDLCKSKNSINGLWEEHTLYKSLSNPQQLYSRKTSDFNNKFKRVNGNT